MRGRVLGNVLLTFEDFAAVVAAVLVSRHGAHLFHVAQRDYRALDLDRNWFRAQNLHARL